MDAFNSLQALSSEMTYEPAEDTGCTQLTTRQQGAVNISHAQLPNGKQIRMLKTLLTSACERNCFYCPFRAGRDFRRVTLSPDEMARAFTTLHRAGVAEGMFLSSGVAGGGLRTQDQMIAVGELLRKKYQYKGYLHLKLMPGAERAQIERTMQLADRVSINLEAPNAMRLSLLAPGKRFMDELLQPLRVADQIRRSQSPHQAWKGRWPSLTTQFVVGAVGENDLEMLASTEDLYRNLRLSRAYYSAFRPISDTPFEHLLPESKTRELRLYQASFLLRDYGFNLEELPFEDGGNLPAGADPKSAWAQANLSEAPLEVNRANRQELLRIPGIGPKSADAILAARRQGSLKGIDDFHRLGINPNRALPYILVDGKRPPRQLALL